jgi:glycerol uptake facilitator-like aquaporin
VTLAFWSSRRFPAAEVVPYLAAQCGGAIAAALTLRTVLGPAGGAAATLPHLPIAGAFTVEWLLSFALMFVIMAVATDDRVAGAPPRSRWASPSASARCSAVRSLERA